MLDKIKSISHIILVSVVAVCLVAVTNKVRGTLTKFDGNVSKACDILSNTASSVKVAADKISSLNVEDLNDSILHSKSITYKVDDVILTTKNVEKIDRTLSDISDSANISKQKLSSGLLGLFR